MSTDLKKRSNNKREVIKIRKKGDSIDYWGILNDYIDMKLSTAQIGEKHSLSKKEVEGFIAKFWKKLLNARESRVLVAAKTSRDLFASMSREYLESNRINEEFMELLSSPEDPLTDNELMFCNLLVETGDEAGSIKGAKLDKGLKTNRDIKNTTNMEGSLRLRALYLKKKKNIAEYIYTLQRDRNEVLKNSKEFIQGTLIELISQIKARNNPRETASLTKNLELLAKLTGDLDNKSTLEIVNGDAGLERIFLKAEEAKGPQIEYMED